MAKITAIIDIGSNSARMAIFEKTSHLGFHLLYETKNNLLLQKANLERAINEIEDAEIRLILKLKFIDLKSWSYIGKIMNYERSTVFKKYKKYLQGERK